MSGPPYKRAGEAQLLAVFCGCASRDRDTFSTEYLAELGVRNRVALVLTLDDVAFARALGEYGATSMIAGYTPGKTATISTTVYQLWRTGDDAGAMRWVLVNLAISAVVLLAVNMLEKKDKRPRRRVEAVAEEVD